MAATIARLPDKTPYPGWTPAPTLIAQFRAEGGIYAWLRSHIPPHILAEAEACRWGLSPGLSR